MATFEIDGISLGVPDRHLTPRIRERLRSGTYEQVEARAVRRCVTPDARVLDLGAGLGLIASLCARIAGAANVVTVEANPDLLPMIRTNLDRNGHAATMLVHGAVGAEGDARTITFRRAPAFWASAIADGTGRGEEIEVPALYLPDLLATHRPNIVVMDVEGAEARLFDAPWPGHVDAVLMELHPKAYPGTAIGRIFDCLSQSGLFYAPDLSRGAVVGFRRSAST